MSSRMQRRSECILHAAPQLTRLPSPPWTPAAGVRAIFGGFLISQSVSAAQATVPDTFSPHSLQSVFLRPGTSVQPITYRVERVADGRTFATRLVRVVQDEVELFVATIGLQKTIKQERAAGFHQYSELMPDLGSATPDNAPSDPTETMMQMGYTRGMLDRGPPDPFTWLHLPQTTATAGDPSTVRLHSFVRSGPLQSDSCAVHLASLFFLTDEWLLGMPTLANPAAAGKNASNIKIQASVNHAIWLHDPWARADDWMVSERATTWADNGRVLVRQKLWNRATGKLVLTCTQEGLVRLGNSKL